MARFYCRKACSWTPPDFSGTWSAKPGQVVDGGFVLPGYGQLPQDVVEQLFKSGAMVALPPTFELTRVEVDMIRAAGEEDLPRLAWADEVEAKAGTVKCEACGGSGKDKAGTFSIDGVSYKFAGDPGPCLGCNGGGWRSNGAAERAEFVRVQVNLAKLERQALELFPLGTSGMGVDPFRETRQHFWFTNGGRKLEYREVKLFEYGTLQGWWTALPMMARRPRRPWHLANRAEAGVVIRRGLPEEVGCTLADWFGRLCNAVGVTGHPCRGGRVLAYGGQWNLCQRCRGTGRLAEMGGGWGPEMVAVHPVTDVALIDRGTYWNGGGYAWYNRDRTEPRDTVPEAATLPAEMFARLIGGTKETVRTGGKRWVSFHTAQAAFNALSAAALAWALAQPE